MPRRAKQVAVVAGNPASYTTTGTVYNRCAESQPGSSISTGRITTSTSALLRALDELPTSKSKGKRRQKDITFRDDVGSSSRTEEPKTKRRKKAKDADGTPAPKPRPPEKRDAIFKKKCPQNIIERVGRVISQRFCMLDRRRNGDELREEFDVLGSTGNVYTVTIDKRPSCTCPDALKGNHCKHILFIFTKVLQVPQASPLWYQKALLTSELEDIFRNAPPAPNAMANARVREAYQRATGRASSSVQPEQTRRMPGADDDCPICYESMHDAQQSSLTWCDTCGNALHRDCLSQWAKKKAANPDCVYCRAPWVGPGSKKAGAGNISEGYVNLGAVAGLSPIRDTSGYYQGPRRGQRYYGYQNYEDDLGC